MLTTIKGSIRPPQSSRPVLKVNEQSDDDDDERPYKTIRTRDRESILPIAADDDDEDEQEEEEQEDMIVDAQEAV